MASAVYSAIVAAATGKEMPSFDFGNAIITTEEVGGATEDATEAA